MQVQGCEWAWIKGKEMKDAETSVEWLTMVPRVGSKWDLNSGDGVFE
jgi:hypothetical protein